LRAADTPPCEIVTITEPAIDDSTQALHGVVGGTVVDHDQLEVAVGLREHAVDGMEDERGPVEGGDDHRELGSVPAPPERWA